MLRVFYGFVPLTPMVPGKLSAEAQAVFEAARWVSGLRPVPPKSSGYAPATQAARSSARAPTRPTRAHWGPIGASPGLFWRWGSFGDRGP